MEKGITVVVPERVIAEIYLSMRGTQFFFRADSLNVNPGDYFTVMAIGGKPDGVDFVLSNKQQELRRVFLSWDEIFNQSQLVKEILQKQLRQLNGV